MGCLNWIDATATKAFYVYSRILFFFIMHMKNGGGKLMQWINLYKYSQKFKTLSPAWTYYFFEALIEIYINYTVKSRKFEPVLASSAAPFTVIFTVLNILFFIGYGTEIIGYTHDPNPRVAGIYTDISGRGATYVIPFEDPETVKILLNHWHDMLIDPYSELVANNNFMCRYYLEYPDTSSYYIFISPEVLKNKLESIGNMQSLYLLIAYFFALYFVGAPIADEFIECFILQQHPGAKIFIGRIRWLRFLFV